MLPTSVKVVGVMSVMVQMPLAEILPVSPVTITVSPFVSPAVVGVLMTIGIISARVKFGALVTEPVGVEAAPSRPRELSFWAVIQPC